MNESPLPARLPWKISNAWKEPILMTNSTAMVAKNTPTRKREFGKNNFRTLFFTLFLHHNYPLFGEPLYRLLGVFRRVKGSETNISFPVLAKARTRRAHNVILA